MLPGSKDPVAASRDRDEYRIFPSSSPWVSDVVRKLDNAFDQINKCYQNKPRYPTDSDLSGGWHYQTAEACSSKASGIEKGGEWRCARCRREII